MRIDKFLKDSRLIKRRTVAKEACDSGRVLINDKVVKAGAEVNSGDIIEIRFAKSNLVVEVTEIIKNPKSSDASEMYRVISSEKSEE